MANDLGTFIWNPGDGDDIVDGEGGTDTLEFNGSDADELMTVTTLAAGSFVFFRNVGDITVDAFNVERVEANGLSGNDTIDGSAQTDAEVELVISGGAGNDGLTGGAGPDTFVFGEETGNDAVETDVITNYSEVEGDVIDVSASGGVVSTEVVGEDLQVVLGGGDNDILILEGITNVADVTFIV